MRARLLAGLLALSACAEMTRPPPPEPPVELAGGLVAQPLFAILDRAAADFDRGGGGLEGRPAETALAVARLEWLGGEARPGGRLSTLPDSYLFGLQRAVQEGRQALAIAPDARSETVVPALLAAARAVMRGDTAAARAALTGPDFRDTDRPVLSRLREPGPFPDAALAIPAIRDEAARLLAEGRTNRRVASEFIDAAITTPGLTGGVGR
ncbi:hypothetical protein EJV46_07060 [Roseococcus sp. SYP-B2431]|uniref:hypothetical protein n=1 Tax=Roseococcus sp. SYP-B2431 TaxID=2496640 RepID=UPI00103E9E17|nr:hypothetical protein [Roseococcus sp. SYP-B2431]TCI00385.1 hypothetical protein EJV46_07060 [Roseococcus sp. SYP-B2431]